MYSIGTGTTNCSNTTSSLVPGTIRPKILYNRDWQQGYKCVGFPSRLQIWNPDKFSLVVPEHNFHLYSVQQCYVKWKGDLHPVLKGELSTWEMLSLTSDRTQWNQTMLANMNFIILVKSCAISHTAPLRGHSSAGQYFYHLLVKRVWYCTCKPPYMYICLTASKK